MRGEKSASARIWRVLGASIAVVACCCASLDVQSVRSEERFSFRISDQFPEYHDEDEGDVDIEGIPVSFFQDQPPLLPPTGSALLLESSRPMQIEFDTALFRDQARNRNALSSARRSRASNPAAEILLGAVDAKLRVTTDTGNLLDKAPSLPSIQAQRRTPIVNDPRVRGNRVSRLAAGGSYWVPARIDLDTMVSKIDSRIVNDVIVIPGPYSVRYGPGFEFIDVELLRSPRFGECYELHGSTSADYQTNGEQIDGRQHVFGGNSNSGFRLGYGHRTGNDYRSGNGSEIPSSYNSRDFDVALGTDLSDDSFIEFSYLRLDQTNVEFPGQAFDIDYLVTDAFDLEYVAENQSYYDRMTVESWYNRTRFDGSAQRPGKRRQFPIYDFLNFVGFTNVDSMSTGFRADVSWGDEYTGELTTGADLRYIKQELNEITSGRIGLALWDDANSPIPRSYSSNPGVFVEYTHRVSEPTRLTAGVRGDSVATNIVDDPAKLMNVGTEVPQLTYQQVVGTDQFDQTFTLWSAYLMAEHDINCCWTVQTGFGYAERPPNLTELYAAQPFMFLLQNGLNTVTGDPLLAPERRWQMDVGLRFDNGLWRAGVRGFHAWMRDYITFEATDTFATVQIEQVNLQYVNTDFATVAGGEVYFEADLTDWITPFATLQYVEGRDHSRNGDFATIQATGGMAKMKDVTQPRGFYSGQPGSAEEPLPGIPPLESRVGVRLHQPSESRWLVEFSARIVDNQDRVATSLFESPTPGFTVWDLRGSWRATDDLLLTAGVENFTDRNYREHLDFRSLSGIQVFQPGVNFYCGAELVY